MKPWSRDALLEEVLGGGGGRAREPAVRRQHGAQGDVVLPVLDAKDRAVLCDLPRSVTAKPVRENRAVPPRPSSAEMVLHVRAHSLLLLLLEHMRQPPTTLTGAWLRGAAARSALPAARWPEASRPAIPRGRRTAASPGGPCASSPA